MTGKIYYCEACEHFTRFEDICPTCGQECDEIGWLKIDE